jgi:hypothetical protein
MKPENETNLEPETNPEPVKQSVKAKKAKKAGTANGEVHEILKRSDTAIRTKDSAGNLCNWTKRINGKWVEEGDSIRGKEFIPA